MNSWSRKDYYDDDCEPCKKRRKDDYDDYKKDKKDSFAFLKCGPVGGTIPVPAATPTPPLVLSTVAVDIPKKHDACVKIEYASTVSVVIDTADDEVTFTVTIFKNCSNNVRIPIGSYTFSITGVDAITSTSSFSFFVCDCNNICPGECCYYSAEITSSTVTDATATVNAPALAALVVSSEHNC